MSSAPPRDGSGRWVSASDLAEYAYCPRAWWYRGNPPTAGRAPESERASRAGERFHRRELAEDWRSDQYGRAYLLLIVVAIVLVFGGVAWMLG